MCGAEQPSAQGQAAGAGLLSALLECIQPAAEAWERADT